MAKKKTSAKDYGTADLEAGEATQQDEGGAYRCSCCRYIAFIVPAWALLSLAGMWYCSIELLKDEKYYYVHYYSIIATIVITFFEAVALLNRMVCCKDDGGTCCAVWRVLMWFDDWKKSIIYIILAIPEFLKGWKFFLAVISGILLLSLAIVYFMKTFKNCGQKTQVNKEKKKEKKDISEKPEAKLLENTAQVQESTPTPSRNAADERWEAIQKVSAQTDERPVTEDPEKQPNDS